MSSRRVQFGSLDLVDYGNIWLRQSGFSAPAPRDGDATRTVTLTLFVGGVNADAMWARYRDLQAQIDRARDVWDAEERSDSNLDAVLEVRIGDSTSNVRFDVLSGALGTPIIGPASMKGDSPFMLLTLTLTCLPFARGTRVTGTVSGTLTSGAASYVDIPDVRGDLPALTQFTFTDVSTNSKVINRITMGVFNSRRPIVAADLELIVDAAAVSPGTSGSESGTIGGTRSRLAMSAAYQNVARFDRPDTLTNGRYHAFVRVRDSSNLLTPPVNLTAVPRTGVYCRQSTTGATGTGTTAQDSWSSATQAGSLLVMYVTSASATHSTPSGWTSGATSGTASTSGRTSLFYKANASAESGAAAASTMGSSVAWEVRLEEWIGITPTSPADVTADDSSSTTATTWAIGPTSVPSQDHVIMLSAFRGGLAPSDIADHEVSTFGTLSMSGVKYVRTAAAQTITATFPPSTNRSGVSVAFKASDVAVKPLPAGLTTFRVIATGASSTYSAASEPVTIRLATGQVAELDWDTGRGTVTDYRVYYTDSTDGWVVAFDVPTITTTTAIVGQNNGSIGTSIPPGAGTAIPADVRLGLSLANGETIWWQDGLRTQYANGAWELLYAGVLTLPPAPTPEGTTPLAWRVHVQARHLSATGNLDVDAMLLLPAWGDMAQFEVPTLDLATKREWIAEAHRDGSASVRLQTTDTHADAGQARAVQQVVPRLRPGFCRVQWLTDVAAGVNDVTDGKVTLNYAYTPLYRFVTGQP